MDHETRRLENLLLNGIKPRLHGVQMRPIALQNDNQVLVVRVPKSWAAPHVVEHEGHWRFYTRNTGSAGRHPLDVGELRSLFNQSGLTQQRIAGFRAERVARILAGEGPASLPQGPLVIMHVIPVNSFDPAVRYDLSSIGMLRLNTLRGMPDSHRINFDGRMFYEYEQGPGDRRITVAFTQLFRDGKVETAAQLRTFLWQQRQVIHGGALERSLVDCYTQFSSVLERLGVTPPILVGVAVVGAKGLTLIEGQSDFIMDYVERGTIDRNDLWIESEMINDLAADPGQVLRPIFDQVWNAAGWDGSPWYDNRGQWIRPPVR